MHLIEKNNLDYELKIETLDDLWILSQFIAPSDMIFGTTIRKVKLGGENSTKQVSKIIFVELLVKKVVFENDTLRVSGEIQNETEFTAIGQSHTLSYGVNDKIKITKKSLLKFEEKILDNSLKSKKTHNLLVLFDKDELVACEFSDFSFRILFEKKGLGSKKYNLEQVNENEEKFKIIEEFLKRDYSQVVFAGPGSWKENLKKYVADKIGLNSLSFSYPDVSSNSVQKVIQKIQSSGLLGSSQIAEEENIVAKLLENIKKQEKCAYGFDDIKLAIGEGKVETLLVSSKFIDKRKEDETYLELNELMRNVEQLNGSLSIINSKHEPGKMVDGLGGIAGILRY
ncbi:MAG: pelota family protein [Nanoarchaeota archaeon]|nr:pelota family protein [Nanoarchaeota archaeon]